MTIGERIKALRKEYGLSQEDLAKRLFISRQSVSLWENGESEPSLSNLLMLKKLYGISLDEWLAEDENAGNSTQLVGVRNKIFFDTKLKNRAKKRKWAVGIFCLVAVLAVLAVGGANLIMRYNILYPFGKTEYSVASTRPIILKSAYDTGEKQVVFETSTLSVEGFLPKRFFKSNDLKGLFCDADGNFVNFAILSEEEKNPIIGTKADGYLNDKGLSSFVSRNLYVLSADLSDVTVFSSREKVEIAGAVRSLRPVVVGDGFAFCHMFEESATGFIIGYAVKMDYYVWSVYWEVDNNTVCSIMIADQAITDSQESLSAFLSTFDFAKK